MSDPVRQCRDAINQVHLINDVKVLQQSSLYRSEPVGYENQEWFVNAAVELRTILTPFQLLEALKCIEKKMGRTKSVKWGPRIIDLDILLYGQDIIQEETLRVPHPEMHKRRFVLMPMCEIAPYAIHSGFGISIRGLLDRLDDNHIVEMI